MRKLHVRNKFQAGLLFFFLIFAFSPFSLFSQTPYDDLKESDRRADEIKQLLIENKSLPENFRMRFSGTREDYLSFYDREGSEIYFRYREDKFDHDAEKKIANLIPGQSYSVRGDYQGVLLSGRFYPVSHPDYLKSLSDKNSILIFLYSGASPLRPDQILFGAGDTFYDPRFFFQFPLPELSLADIHTSGGFDGAEIEALKTRNYFITLDAFHIDKIEFRPPPFGGCNFDAIPFSKKIKIQKSCPSDAQKIKREFVFYRRENNLFIFKLSYKISGEKSAVLIMENLEVL